MPAVLFNTSFSQTYANLLRNTVPYDVKSELTESEKTNIIPNFKSGIENLNSVHPIITPTKRINVSVLSFSPGNKVYLDTEMQEIKEDPELKFFMKVLERMKKTHKDVVSWESLNEIRGSYTRYLA